MWLTPITTFALWISADVHRNFGVTVRFYLIVWSLKISNEVNVPQEMRNSAKKRVSSMIVTFQIECQRYNGDNVIQYGRFKWRIWWLFERVWFLYFHRRNFNLESPVFCCIDVKNSRIIFFYSAEFRNSSLMNSGPEYLGKKPDIAI